MKVMPPTRWISISALLVFLAGCTSSKEEMLPHGDQTMMDIWNGKSATEHRVIEARQQLRRPLQEHEGESVDAYTRTAANEIRSQFPRLPNPDLVMYVYPHLAGGQQVPVPGYWTVFPFYQRVQYALPGERTENY